MDFHLDDDLQAVQALAREIFTDKATTDRVRAIETTDTAMDDQLWKAVTDAGLIGVAVDEEHDGSGLGLSALVVLLEEQGRHVAPVPVWSAALAALTLAEHGDRAQQDRVAALVAGTERLTVALEEFATDATQPACRAEQGVDGWQLTGVKAVVPSPAGVSGVLVSASTADGTGVFLVDNDNLDWEITHTTTYDRAGNLTLAATPAQRVGDADTLQWMLRRAQLCVAALQLGVADEAMHITARYLTDRKQFGRPLGTFQGVQHQLADCWIDVDNMRVTVWGAVTALDDATDQELVHVLAAKWWAAEAGLNVVHRTQHLHGGIGVDVDYPVHRYFLWGKQLSSTLGGAAETLQLLGDQLRIQEVEVA